MDDNRFADAIEELKAAIDRSVGGGDLEIKLVISVINGDGILRRDTQFFRLEAAGSQAQVGEDVCSAVEQFTADMRV